MINNAQLYAKYGDPASKKFVNTLVVWDVPAHLEIGFIPKRIYCHPALIPLLEKAFTNLIERGYVNELKTWDGCWNHRAVRGYEKKYANAMAKGNTTLAITYLSIHSWALAIDLNAAENGLGKKPRLSEGFVKCFTDVGFDWGGSWVNRPDGMHFQISKI